MESLILESWDKTCPTSGKPKAELRTLQILWRKKTNKTKNSYRFPCCKMQIWSQSLWIYSYYMLILGSSGFTTGARHHLVYHLGSSSSPADLVLLACNWSTMGDGFFVCHHLAALYAYGYVLVSPNVLLQPESKGRKEHDLYLSRGGEVCWHWNYRYAMKILIINQW